MPDPTTPPAKAEVQLPSLHTQFESEMAKAFESAAEFQPKVLPAAGNEATKTPQQQGTPPSEKGADAPVAAKAGEKAPAEVPAVTPATLPDFHQAKEVTATPAADDETKGMTQATASQWKAMKAKYEARIHEIEANAKEAQAKAVEPEEVAQLKKSNEELLQRMKQFAIEKDPRFEAYFNGKINQTLALAKSVGGEHGDAIAKLLLQPDSDHRTNALNELVQALPPISQARVGAVMNQMDQIQQERQGEIAKATENFAAIQKQNQQAQMQSQAQIAKEFDGVLAQAKQHLAAFQTKEGDTEWNQSVAQREALVRHIVSGKMTPAELARAATWAATAPALLQDLKARDAEIESLRKQMSSLEAAKPNTGAPSAQSKQPDPNENLDFGERIAALAFGR